MFRFARALYCDPQQALACLLAGAVFSHVIRELYIGNQAPSDVKKTSYLEAGPHIYPRNLPGKEGPGFCGCCYFCGKQRDLQSHLCHISSHNSASPCSILSKSYLQSKPNTAAITETAYLTSLSYKKATKFSMHKIERKNLSFYFFLVHILPVEPPG